MDDVLFASLLFLLVSSLFILIYYKKNKSGSGALPPGSTGWPVIGEILEFVSTGRKGHPEKFVFDRTAKYSSTVFRTHLLGENMVVFSGAAANKFLFSNEEELVRSWWPTSFDKIFRSNSAWIDNQERTRLRKMTPNFLKPEALHSYVGVMDRAAQRNFADGWEKKKQVAVVPLAKDYTFSVACQIFLSIDHRDHQLVDKLPQSSFEVLSSAFISIPIDLPGTALNKGIKTSKLIKKELLSIIRQRKINLQVAEGRADDILSHMLLYSDENGEFMKEMEIADKILGLLVGGYDSVSSACACIVSYLADLPQIYDAVYKEQMEIAKSKATGELLNWEDLRKMKYSWNVACEVLRLAPPVQGAFREAIADFAYNGFSIPKGWKLYWNANSTHQNPEYYPEPQKFDPSRFEGSGPAPYTFVPFGGGPRMCPGNEYARLGILVFMHHLVKRFRWEKIIPDEKIVMDPLPKPAKGLPVRLFPHKP